MVCDTEHHLPKVSFVIGTLARQISQSALNNASAHQSIGEIITNNSLFCHQQPGLGYPDPPNIRQLPTQMPDILTPLTSLEPVSQKSSLNSKAKTIPALLAICLEIRLQIYSYVLQSHPIQHAHLSALATSSTLPPYATEEFHQFVKFSYESSHFESGG